MDAPCCSLCLLGAHPLISGVPQAGHHTYKGCHLKCTCNLLTLKGYLMPGLSERWQPYLYSVHYRVPPNRSDAPGSPSRLDTLYIINNCWGKAGCIWNCCRCLIGSHWYCPPCSHPRPVIRLWSWSDSWSHLQTWDINPRQKVYILLIVYFCTDTISALGARRSLELFFQSQYWTESVPCLEARRVWRVKYRLRPD